MKQLQANGQGLRHPDVSPLLADFSLGFVPTLLTADTRDLLQSNAVRMHRAMRRANVHAKLHVFDGDCHIGLAATPEVQDIDTELRKFIATHMGKEVAFLASGAGLA